MVIFLMVYYLIVCRSLTFAQRTASALERAGINTTIMRAPQSISKEGCSFAVRIAERDLSRALVVLRRVGITSNRIYIATTGGIYREVEL